MIRVVVVDDEPLARQGVVARLAGHDDVSVAGVHGDGESARSAILRDPPDLVFLDIEMPGMTGFELLAAIPESIRPLAIMLTAYDSHAVRAFEIHAVDYLLKPIDNVRFVESLDRARHALAYRHGRAVVAEAPRPLRFPVKLGAKRYIVETRDIDWIEADGDYAVLHVGRDTHLIRQSLFALGKQLDPDQFVRVHRSAIVRVDRVVELEPLVNRDTLLRLRDGTPLRASRTYIRRLEEALGQHRNTSSR